MRCLMLFLALTAGVLPAAASDARIREILEGIDPWVVDDTARVMAFIEGHNQRTVERLEFSPHWKPTLDELGDLLGIDFLAYPDIDNTGRIYFHMRITGEKEALFYVDEPWGWPVQVTPNAWGDEGLEIGAYRLEPDGEYFYLRVMKHGDENWDLYRFERDGSYRRLLEDRSVSYGIPHIIDDDSFYFSIDNRQQIWIGHYSIASGEVDTLYTEPGAFYPVDARDGKILCVRFISFSEHQLFEFDPLTAQTRDVTGVQLIWGADYTKDGRILLLTDALSKEEEFMKLALLDPATGETELLFDPGAEIDGFTFSRERGVACVALNRDGYTELVALNLKGKTRSVPMPGVGISEEVAINANGELVIGFNSPSTPPMLTYHKIGRRGMTTVGAISTFGYDFSQTRVEVVRYPSTDGVLIPALLYVPPGAARDASNPCIVEYHGGPPAQSRPYFQRNIAFGLSRGLVYFFPNVRGSTGYGPAWERADNLEGRFQALADAEAALDYLVEEGWTRPERTAIWGASYGGYTVNYLAVQAPEKFACGVSDVGVADVDWCNEHSDQTFLEGWEREMGALGSDLTHRLSPIFFADAVRRPLYVTAGFNDPRVPASGPRRFAHVLDELGKDVLYYEEVEAGHGTARKSDIARSMARAYTFMFDHILEGGR